MTVRVIMQARMGSSRLPGKVLAELSGAPLLTWVIRRASMAQFVDDLVVATTTGSMDDPLEAVVGTSARVVRGSESDVLDRFVQASIDLGDDDIIVRLTADCPLLDPVTLDRCVDRFASSEPDLVRAGAVTGFPRGLDVEVTSAGRLRMIAAQATSASDREHVMPYFYSEVGRFEVIDLSPPPDLARPDLRLCVDELADLEMVTAVYDALQTDDEPVEIRQVLAWLDLHPSVAAHNRLVEQKHA